MIAKCKEIIGFDEKTIRNDLKKEDMSDVRLIYILMEILFSPCVMDIAKNLEMDFKKDGNRHYPRLLLLGILMYCFARKIFKYKDIVEHCKMNRFLRIFTRGAQPCESTLRNFINSNKTEEFRKLFLYTLLRFNEYDLLKYLHTFIDSTEAIIRGSKYFKIYKIELEAMRFMAEHNLLHNKKPKLMKEAIKKLNRMKLENPDDIELIKLIDIIIPRIHIYNRKMYKKIDIFEEAIENSNKNFVCITYPNSRLIKGKKGNWTFAKNLQMAVTDNNIIIGSIFINDPNDSYALEKLLPVLQKNFEMLAELVDKYGTRNNTSEISNLLKQSMIICDSGYDSEANIVYLHENEYRSLIMPRITATYINRQMKKFDLELEQMSGETDNLEELEKYGKSDMKRIWNGVLCQFDRPIVWFKDTPIPNEEKKGLPYIATKRNFYYRSSDCSGCPYQETCKYQVFIEKISPYTFESMNKFTQEFYRDLYMDRFQKSESVFGYFKGIDELFHLMGNNDTAISNEMDILSAVYNTIHFVEMKGTFC